MTELRINGFKQARKIVGDLLPFIRFKKKQARALYKASSLLASKKSKHLSERDLRMIADRILVIQENNYVTRRKKTKHDIYEMLGLTP